MRDAASGRLGGPGLNTRILLLGGVPLLLTALVAAVVVNWSTRRFGDDEIGDQMLVEARIVAHLVGVAERDKAAGMSPEAVNAELKEIARFAKARQNYDYEFWITDSSGKVVYGTQGVDFTFKEDQPQAG